MRPANYLYVYVYIILMPELSNATTSGVLIGTKFFRLFMRLRVHRNRVY